MPISQESQNVLAAMERAGVDPVIIAGLQRELDSKPNADKATTDMLLSQAGFNTYKAKKEQEIIDLKNNLTKLSGLQGAAANLDGDLKKAALEQITALEKIFEAQGYDLEEVRSEAAKMVSDPNKVKELVEKKEEKKDMPNQAGTLDEKTVAELLRVSGNNLAAGGIHMSAKIAVAIDKARQMGIKLTDEQLNELPNVIIKGLEQNIAPEVALDKHLGFSVKQTEISETQRKAELDAAREEGRREALKKKGVEVRKEGSSEHPLYSRGYGMKEKKPEERKRFQDITQEDIDKLPKNEKGDPEIFRLRRNDEFERRAAHTENATERWEKEKQNFSDEGEFIGHLNQQTV